MIHGDTLIHNTCNAKFLELIIDNTLSWKDNINQLAIKWSLAAHAIRTLSFIMSQVSLLLTYYASFYYVLTELCFGTIHPTTI
jgi:hypothetical protein